MAAESGPVSSTSLSSYLAPDDRRDALRALAGLLIGLGLTMVFVRKGSSVLGATWGDFALFLVLLVATAFLYGFGLAGRAVTGEPRAWEGVYTVFGVLLVPLTLLQFVQLVGGDTGASLNIAWIFLVTAGFAAFAGMNGFRYQWLLASLAIIISWSAFWNKVLSNGLADHFDIYRILLLVIGGILLAAGWSLGAGRSRSADSGPADRGAFSEFVTGASVAGVIAGSLGVAKLAALTNPFIDVSNVSSAVGWEIVLLVVALAAVAYGARSGVRGPVYVGGIGLFLFLLVAGLDLNDSSPSGSLVGWPLILLIVGLVAFVASMRPASNKS